MASYNTPGVYVEEIPSLPATISAVDTAIPVFIGYTAYATNDPLNTGSGDLLNAPKRIQSMSEYIAHFGGPESTITLTVSGSTGIVSNNLTHILYYCMEMYFNNGGGPCYVMSIGAYGALDHTQMTAALNTLKKYEEPTLVVIPEAAKLSQGNFQTVAAAMLTHCQEMGDRFAILDTLLDSDMASGLDDIRGTGMSFSTDEGSYGAVYFPALETSLSYPFSAVTVAPAQSDYTTLAEGMAVADSDATVANLLQPWLQGVRDEIANNPIKLPPSAAIAGLYARVDRNRGVWKAPANEPLKNVVAPSEIITDAQQAGFNVDPTGGRSINVIRQFTGRGNLVWGARTLDGNSGEWRYISVRRLFLMVEESISNAMQSVVFEPNDQGTWVRVKAMIENFLTSIWRDGGLAGATPKEAFYVKVGLNETMNAQDILDGRLIVQIGMAATRPAEFIVLRFSHLLQTS